MYHRVCFTHGPPVLRPSPSIASCARQFLVQYRGGLLQRERGDFGLLDGVAATRPWHQGVVERVQSESHPHGHRRRPDLRFSVSIHPDQTSGGFACLTPVWCD